MNITPRPLLAALAALSGLSSAAVWADQVLAFGPATDHVTADTAFATSATRTGAGPYTYLNAFDDTQALSPASGYSGPVFYGGYTMTSSTVQGSSLAGAVLNNWSLIGGNDALRIYANVSSGWDGSTLGFSSVYIFKQADFSAPYGTGDFSLDGLSVTYRASGAGGAFLPTGRWVVQVDGAYYVSQATITATYNTVSTISLSGSALSSTLWAAYNPSSSLNFDQSVSFSSLDLSQVTAVGVYFEHDSYLGTSDASAALLAISAFSATGTVSPIPEPSSAALLLGLSAAAVVMLRRSSRR